MWSWRYEIRFPSEGLEHERGPLIVQMVPRASPPPAPRSAPQPEPQRPQVAKPTPAPKPAPKAIPKPKPAPPVIARAQPAPDAPVVPQPTPPAPAAAPPRAPEGDLSALVEARRRARGEVASPAPPPGPGASGSGTAEDANARATRLAAANLGSDRRPSFGSDPRKGGGVFTIEHIGYDTADFTFFGWNKEIQRNTLQTIPVRKGNEPDIRIAIVRRMIAVIREQEKEDFVWESKRLGRNVTLSARPADTPGLEAFLMREFFESGRSP